MKDDERRRSKEATFSFLHSFAYSFFLSFIHPCMYSHSMHPEWDETTASIRQACQLQTDRLLAAPSMHCLSETVSESTCTAISGKTVWICLSLFSLFCIQKGIRGPHGQFGSTTEIRNFSPSFKNACKQEDCLDLSFPVFPLLHTERNTRSTRTIWVYY